MDKDNKRGFSGLSDLATDSRTVPQPQNRQASPHPSARQKSVFALLELTKWPAKDDRWPGAGAWASGNGTARQKEKLWMRLGDSFVHWHWRPGRLGSDVHMRELGMKFMCKTEGDDAHGW